MLVVRGSGEPNLIINQEAIDDCLRYGQYSHKEWCNMKNFDYNLFKRIYNNDLSVTIEDLIKFGEAFRLSLSEFVILF